MGIDFKASEVLEIAEKIEEHGEAFYRHAATICDDQEIKGLFDFLAGEELKHQKIFKEMLSKIEHYNPPESYPGEYFQYLRAYSDNQVFSEEEFKKRMDEIDNVEDAMEFAIQKELESILYYLEMRNFVPEGAQRAEIDKIVEEERSHYLKLTEIKKNL
jgi:rubrerythrin